ncbi:hypothetical protein NQ317_013422 [Molorchus minor]|uniref:Major facilitator superfamily (MFS) profile domain-containing protein n=1 Tax=Molorchus minor TaxID=1323400 RepID=A0ABQ9JSJ0_9CUCU|nr:hypothetical protein NQ317_013422 [Molorchus minor]
MTQDKTIKEDGTMEDTYTGPRFGIRHAITILLFLLLSIAYGMRVNLSVAIVAMTDNTTSENPDIPTYDWNNKSVILSSFFWGYIILQVFAGQLGRTYGTKWFLVGAMFINSSGCMLIPIMAAKLGSGGVMACRVLQGLSQGFFFPSIHNLLGQWAPTPERSRLGTIVFSGVAFGTIVTMPITGYMSASWVGWPPTFYLFGLLGYSWAITWAFFGSNSPAEHPRISEEERHYIEFTLGTEENTQTAKTPWKAMMTSLPAWAIIVGNFGQNWGYSTLLTEIPNYMNKVMGFDMESNSLLSSAPYLALFIFSFVFGQLSDYMINNGYGSRAFVRKLFNSIGTFGPAIALVTLGFLPKDATDLSVTMLIIAVGINAAVFCGFQVNHIDLSPKFSGILMGIGNGSSNSFSIIAPLIVQLIVTDETDKTLWRTIFIISAAVYIASDIFFIIFAKGEVQWWDSIAEDNVEKNTETTANENNRSIKV